MSSGESARLESLRRLEVMVEGDWCSGRVRRWQGVARAAESLVGVAWVTSGESSRWCKSKRASPDGQQVGLLLGHYDASGLDVQVSFSVGRGSARVRCTVPSEDYKPSVPGAVGVRTGEPSRLATIYSTPEIVLSLMFIAGSDVTVGRNGLWHIRRELAESVPEPLRSILSYGRAGQLEA